MMRAIPTLAAVAFCGLLLAPDGDRAVALSPTGHATRSLSIAWTHTSRDPGLPIATTDALGNVYIAGTTKGRLHTTVHAFQIRYGGGFSDAYVEKLTPQGTLVYATYLGGNRRELPSGIAVDAQGDVYVTGVTASTDFPTRHAMQPKYGGHINGDAFVAKINPSGSNLIFSTYLGGKGWDEGMGIALDAQGYVYVAIETNSPNMPTYHALQSHLPSPGCGDLRSEPPCTAFVAKLDPSGSPVYSTYLYSKRTGTPHAIAVDAGGTANVLTPTRDSMGYAANGGVLTKLDAAGDKVVFRKVLPVYVAAGLAVDRQGAVYVTGTVGSDNPKVPPRPFPSTPGAFQPTSAGLLDAFVMKLDGGAHLLYATYLGGSPWGRARGVAGDDFGTSIAVDGQGDAYVGGETFSKNFPTEQPIHAHYRGGTCPAPDLALRPMLQTSIPCPDGFLSELSPDGRRLLFSTYLGSRHGGTTRTVAVGTAGDLVIAGAMDSHAIVSKWQ